MFALPRGQVNLGKVLKNTVRPHKTGEIANPYIPGSNQQRAYSISFFKECFRRFTS